MSQSTESHQRGFEIHHVYPYAPRIHDEHHHMSWREFFDDTWVCMIVAVFTILAPVLALGWTMLPWDKMALFWAVYLASQNVPTYFSKRFFKWDFGAGVFLPVVTYFHVRYTKACKLDPSKSYILAWHPHGRLFVGVGAFLGKMYDWLPEMDVGNQHIFFGINDTMFRIPFISYWFSLIGLIPVNKHAVKKCLGDGNSIAIVVGGIEEVLLGTYEDKDVLYLSKRLGFAKIAMDKGAGLVPIYCFGENQLFTHATQENLTFWRWINKFIKLGAPFPIAGRWGLPFPFRRPLLVAFGEPIFAREGETLPEFHARYVEALQALYKANVGLTPDPKRRLVIA
mmetsp:Transcript_12914/g.32538  ORF Transcript_12914/g.32538 Transcript_12914/m.32538 type:complete len:339 (+) Transcript_12914:201-1217(+)